MSERRTIPIYQVDAFTSRRFAGNPAAVCPLETWLADDIMQAIAAENNLSETAFFVRTGERYQLRWFTPLVEVDLCGHATLASAFVITRELEPARDTVVFDSRSGELRVTRDGDALALDFPASPPRRIEPDPELAAALGRPPVEMWRAGKNALCVYEREQDVRELAPDMVALVRLRQSVIASAPGTDVDFVSRYFAPAWGVPEDPVTGSAHCALAPYWSARLARPELRARQISTRGGELWVTDRGDRTRIAGHAVLYLRGTIEV
jgi:PhzF family phenazine biosynthesis protein